MKRFFILLVFIPVIVFAEPLYSPTWGFLIDLPEGYNFTGGDGKDRFSFSGPEGLMFETVVYNGRYASILELVNDINSRLSNQGYADLFQYRDKQAAIINLNFGESYGWALAIELGIPEGSPSSSARPMLLALAYAPSNKKELELFHISALDSICTTPADLRYPGPITEYGSDRGSARNAALAIRGVNASIRENDAEISQLLIEREFKIMEAYLNTSYIQAACIRYYRFIYRDSYDRIAEAAAAIARNLGGNQAVTDDQKREFAQKVLSFVQGFNYERDLSGSDFINLVTAITEGRGDCDSRSMLFALILSKAQINSAIMLSHQYSHAMGLADITGYGARFEAGGTEFLVAETTDKINIGLIDQQIGDPRHWFAIIFE